MLEPFPDDPGPRETIAPLNPLNVEKLAIKKGDVLFGRPVMTGCPVTHVGVVVEDPDYLSGSIVWCIVGLMAARERGREIGYYHTIAYEGIVRHARQELQIGRRYFFLPRMCNAAVAALGSGQRPCQAREWHAGAGGRDMDRLAVLAVLAILP